MERELRVEVSSSRSGDFGANGSFSPSLVCSMEQIFGDEAAMIDSIGRVPFDASRFDSFVYFEVNNRPDKLKGNMNLTAKLQDVRRALKELKIQSLSQGNKHISFWFFPEDYPDSPEPVKAQTTWRFETFSPSPIENSAKFEASPTKEFCSIFDMSSLYMKSTNPGLHVSGTIRLTPEKFIHCFFPPEYSSLGFWGFLRKLKREKYDSSVPFWRMLWTVLDLLDAHSEVTVLLKNPESLSKYVIESKEWDSFRQTLAKERKVIPKATQQNQKSGQNPLLNEDEGSEVHETRAHSSSIRARRSVGNKQKVAFKDQKVKVLMQKGGSSVRKDAKPSEFYNILDLLGTGGFGVVKKVEHKVSNQFRAMKILKKKNMPEEQLALTFNEIQMLRTIDHPHVGRLYDVYETEKTIYIVMDLFSGGDLFEKISENGNLPESQAKRITKEIIAALQFLHSNGVVHRDLKPENIMMLNKTDESPIKVIDFGISARFTTGEKMSEFYGTCFYMAPELILGEYDEKVDMWSTGVIVYMMLSASLPFYHEEEDQIYQMIVDGNYTMEGGAWDQVSAEAKDFVSYLMTANPEERPSARDALNHPWLKKIDKKDDVEVSKKTKFQALKQFKSFQAGIELQRAVFEFMATNLSVEDEKLQLLKAFSQIDKNGDGILTCEELLGAVKEFPELEIDEKMVKDIFGEIDSNLSGEIDYNEFLMACMDRVSLLRQENLRKAFDLLDEDKNGYVDPMEFKKAFGVNSIGENGGAIDQIIEELISDFDTNKDGLISFEEFVAMMQKIEQ